jgi:hypothetical protein
MNRTATPWLWRFSGHGPCCAVGRRPEFWNLRPWWVTCSSGPKAAFVWQTTVLVALRFGTQISGSGKSEVLCALVLELRQWVCSHGCLGLRQWVCSHGCLGSGSPVLGERGSETWILDLDLCRSAMDKADQQIFPVGCHRNVCSHRDEIFL